MKARIIGFLEVKDKFKEVIMDLDRRPMDEELVVKKAGELAGQNRGRRKSGDKLEPREPSDSVSKLIVACVRLAPPSDD